MQVEAFAWRHREFHHLHALEHGGPIALQLGDRGAGGAIHLEGALDALWIVYVDAGRRGRIHSREFLVKALPAPFGRLRVDLPADARVRLRQFREPGREGVEVQHRAADQQRLASPRPDLAHGLARIAQELPCRIAHRRIADVDQMVRDPLTGRKVRLGGADIHAAIHLCGVDAHDLERQSVGEFEGNVGLARARWAHEQQRAPAAAAHQRPRMNNRSRSPSDSRTHVGRP